MSSFSQRLIIVKHYTANAVSACRQAEKRDIQIIFKKITLRIKVKGFLTRCEELLILIGLFLLSTQSKRKDVF